MAAYFHRLASHAAVNRLAVVDPAPSTSSPARQHTYAELLQRVTVYRERLIAAAEQAKIRLEGARIGLIAPPGVDFIAALLGIWSVTAIVGRAKHPLPIMRLQETLTHRLRSSDMSYASLAGDYLHGDQLRSGNHRLSPRL